MGFLTSSLAAKNRFVVEAEGVTSLLPGSCDEADVAGRGPATGILDKERSRKTTPPRF